MKPAHPEMAYGEEFNMVRPKILAAIGSGPFSKAVGTAILARCRLIRSKFLEARF
jgi:hypothetical protein